ncbi:MAG: hypothetical protein KBD24_04390 [Candidatus Pacebacteria bacterium]|nr:hypothetical protein [Candidatus Paceibacterota bacterium]
MICQKNVGTLTCLSGKQKTLHSKRPQSPGYLLKKCLSFCEQGVNLLIGHAVVCKIVPGRFDRSPAAPPFDQLVPQAHLRNTAFRARTLVERVDYIGRALPDPRHPSLFDLGPEVVVCLPLREREREHVLANSKPSREFALCF